jgi:hypothetical protein
MSQKERALRAFLFARCFWIAFARLSGVCVARVTAICVRMRYGTRETLRSVPPRAQRSPDEGPAADYEIAIFEVIVFLVPCFLCVLPGKFGFKRIGNRAFDFAFFSALLLIATCLVAVESFLVVTSHTKKMLGVSSVGVRQSDGCLGVNGFMWVCFG